MIDSFLSYTNCKFSDRTVRCSIIIVGDVTQVDDAGCTNQLETATKQRIKQLTNGYFIKMDLQELAYQPQ